MNATFENYKEIYAEYLLKWTPLAARRKIKACKNEQETGAMFRGLSRRMGRAMRLSIEWRDESFFMVAEHNERVFEDEYDKICPQETEWINHPEAYNDDDEEAF